MATVAAPSITSKPIAFYCIFHGLSGVITKPGEHVLFLEPESGSVVRLTDADLPELVVNGEVASAMAQWVADMARGGYAAQACSRAMGVS